MPHLGQLWLAAVARIENGQHKLTAASYSTTYMLWGERRGASPLSVLAGRGSMSSTEETLEARSTTEERAAGQWRAFTAAAKRE